MALTLKTDDKGVKIYVKERQKKAGGTFLTYAIGFAQKNGEGWINAYLDCDFKKEDKSKITHKCKIKINNAFPTATQYNGKTYVKYMITDFEVLEEGESLTNPDEFMKISSVEDEIPFL